MRSTIRENEKRKGVKSEVRGWVGVKTLRKYEEGQKVKQGKRMAELKVTVGEKEGENETKGAVR